MRTLLLKSVAAGAVLAALSAAAPAMAADLPVASPVEPAFVPAQVMTWQGFYVGIQGGYAFEADNDDDDDFDDDDIFDSSDTVSLFSGDDDGGFIVGGTVGYNFQAGNFVFGVEGDAAYADFGGDDEEMTFVRDGVQTTASLGLETNFFATARGRIGYAFDRFMIFATGGAAFVNLESDFNDEDDLFDDEGSDFLFGYTVGGGLEYMITDNISAKVEYLYVNFEDELEDIGGLEGFEVETDFHVVRGGINFKFNSLFGG